MSKICYHGREYLYNVIPPGYVVPEGTYPITTSGIYDVASYASVDVQVSGGDTDIEDKLITHTLSGVYSNSRINSIANYAFDNCALTSVNFSNCSTIGSYAFRSCFSLVSISFPNCISIGSYAFYGCSSLASADFSNCSTIGDYAFRSCYSLTSANFPSCTSIGSYAFYDCSSLTSISFPSCTSIGTYAFYGCSSLASADFSNYSSAILAYVFYGCSSLVSINFLNCTYIATNAFRNCTALTSVTFSNCTSIGSGAFGNCTALISANFPQCTSIYGGGTVNSKGTYTYSGAFHSCPALTSISFPNCITIYSAAFYRCSALTEVNFPKVKYIYGTYSSSKSAASTTIHYFYGGAFAFCNNLSVASFPALVSLSRYTFYKCYNLLSLYLLGSSVVDLQAITAFASTPISDYTTSTGGVHGSIFVPASLYDSYITAANWSVFSARIVSV